jgi:FkbM family methyltransferase
MFQTISFPHIMPKSVIYSIFNNLPRMFKYLRGQNLFFEISYNCSRKSFGNKNASFTINPDIVSSSDIVYSVGIGTDISFDLELIEAYNPFVFAFDPTPKSIEWLSKQSLPEKFKAFPFGLADYTGDAVFYLPQNENFVSASMTSKQSDSVVHVKVKKIVDIMAEFGHTEINILKIDIEGAEYSVIDDIIKSDIKIHQLLIEFHHRFPQNGIEMTRNAVLKLKNAGYDLFYVSPLAEEFSFINRKFHT